MIRAHQGEGELGFPIMCRGSVQMHAQKATATVQAVGDSERIDPTPVSRDRVIIVPTRLDED